MSREYIAVCLCVCVCVCVCDDDRHYVLATTNQTDISDVGQVRWHVTLCLTLSWVIVFLCILKGVKSSGKVSQLCAFCCFQLLACLLAVELDRRIWSTQHIG